MSNVESLKAAAAQPNSHLRAHQSERDPNTAIDLTFHNHGSVWLMEPRTPLADEWIAECFPDDVMMLGNNVVIETRYVADVVIGAITDGLSVDMFN